jgi:hypothetical protein
VTQADNPYRCRTVASNTLAPVHLAAEAPTPDGPSPALCGATCSRSVPALLFLRTGCPACARRALANGITTAGDRRGGVSLQRIAAQRVGEAS